MIEIKSGKVIRILDENSAISIVLVDINHKAEKAINYNYMTGQIKIGDFVYLNTSAATLSLGTGGFHFVIANLANRETAFSAKGHGMKLKYTPMQVQVQFIEEDTERNLNCFNKPLMLGEKVVIFFELHSMLPPICAYLKELSDKQLKLSYIMTDHGALPMWFSKNVQTVREKGLLDCTIASGNAFGADFECVNIYTSLQTASLLSDIIIISMGPGIIGTNCKYGFSALELAFYINLVSKHGGKCVFVPRISFADKRVRHYGISHHSLTMVSEMLDRPVIFTLPYLDDKSERFFISQLREAGALPFVKLSIYDGTDIIEVIKKHCPDITTMGRTYLEDPCFFYTIGASCKKAYSLF